MDTATLPTRFATGYALSQLPWFELHGGDLVVADPEVGPIIDVHTHLALSFVRAQTVDLESAPRPTEHYLPMERPLDLTLYSNRNLVAQDLVNLKRDLGIQVLRRGGMRATHTVPNLVREMDGLGIVRSVLLPIEFPWLSFNADRYLAVASRNARLLSFGSVHPKDRRFAEKLEAQAAAGARGVKIHPAVQHLRPDHPSCYPVYRKCAELGLPVLWHCGPVGIEDRHGRYCSQLRHYWRAVHDNPQTTFVLGHTGALQNSSAVALANAYPNVWCELACQSLPAVRYTIENAPADRLMFGTDWPFYHQSHNIARVLLSTSDAATRRRVFVENAARLFELDLDALSREHRVLMSRETLHHDENAVRTVDA